MKEKIEIEEFLKLLPLELADFQIEWMKQCWGKEMRCDVRLRGFGKYNKRFSEWMR